MSTKKLILLPGLDGTGDLFQPFIQAMGEEYHIQVIRYPRDQTLDYQGLVELVEKQLDPNQSVHILAESFSGAIALKLLERNSIKIDKLILVASFIATPKKPLLSIINRLPIDRILSYKIPDQLLKLFCLGTKASQEMIDSFHSVVRSVSPQVIAFRLKELMKLDKMQFKFDNCKAVYYLQAKNDRLVSARHLKKIKKGCQPGIQSIKGPHFILQAEPKACAQVVKAMIRD